MAGIRSIVDRRMRCLRDLKEIGIYKLKRLPETG